MGRVCGPNAARSEEGCMCPECFASAAWIVGGAISTGSASALLIQTFRLKTTTDSKQRRKQDGNGNQRETASESGVPSGMAEGAPGTVNQGEGIRSSTR